MAQVKLDLKSLNPIETAQFGENVVGAMTGNANFPTPNPALSQISAKAQEIRARDVAVKAAELALAQARADLRQSADDMDSLLTSAGTYVQGVADQVERDGGDAVMVIKGAAMDVKAPNTPIGQLPRPENLQINNAEHDGDIAVHCQRVRGASSYFWQSCAGDDPIGGTWTQSGASTACLTTLTGFTLGTRIWIRVAALGAAGQGPWSEPSSLIVA